MNVKPNVGTIDKAFAVSCGTATVVVMVMVMVMVMVIMNHVSETVLI